MPGPGGTPGYKSQERDRRSTPEAIYAPWSVNRLYDLRGIERQIVSLEALHAARIVQQHRLVLDAAVLRFMPDGQVTNPVQRQPTDRRQGVNP